MTEQQYNHVTNSINCFTYVINIYSKLLLLAAIMFDRVVYKDTIYGLSKLIKV